MYTSQTSWPSQYPIFPRQPEGGQESPVRGLRELQNCEPELLMGQQWHLDALDLEFLCRPRTWAEKGEW
jgi:hypothetical protein